MTSPGRSVILQEEGPKYVQRPVEELTFGVTTKNQKCDRDDAKIVDDKVLINTRSARDRSPDFFMRL